MSDVTRLLDAALAGDPSAAGELLPLVYDELRKLAASRLAAEPTGSTLQPTALVHEAYLRLVGSPGGDRWDHRGHFFAAAAEAMRRILIDAACQKATARRGGRLRCRALDPEAAPCPEPGEELLALNEALDRLALEDPLKAQLVKLRYFAGLSLAEGEAQVTAGQSAGEVSRVRRRQSGQRYLSHWTRILAIGLVRALLTPALTEIAGVTDRSRSQRTSESQTNGDPGPDQIRRPPDVRPGTEGPASQARLPDVTNTLGMRFRFIPAGNFTMGSPKQEIDFWLAQVQQEGQKSSHRSQAPEHDVEISKPF
jgi:RNA polymerase sigma factor (TIGR02999 family)